MEEIEITSGMTVALSPMAANTITAEMEKGHLKPDYLVYKMRGDVMLIYFTKDKFVEVNQHDWTPIHEA